MADKNKNNPSADSTGSSAQGLRPETPDEGPEQTEGGKPVESTEGQPKGQPPELESMKANYLRAVADLENLRKRHAREREEFLRYGNASIVSDILPVVDNFEIALKSAEEHHPEAKGLLEGLGMIIPQLTQVLKTYGVEALSPKPGEAFDPHLHQSVGESPCATIPHQAILALQRPGYRINDRLLRPAMVTLSSGPEKK